jgi:hypothetical protein
LAGFGFEGYDTVAIDVESFAVASIEIARHRTDTGKKQASLHINGNGTPGVGAGTILPLISTL